MTDKSSKTFSNVDGDATSGSPSSSQQPGSTTEEAGPKPSGSTRTETFGITGSTSSSKKTQRFTKTTTERSATTCSQHYKSELVSPKVAPPNETMSDIDGSNSTSSSQKNKDTQINKRRGSTDLLLIAAAQREASDSTKPENSNGCTRSMKLKNEKKVSSSPNKRQQKQPPPTKASGRNKGTPRPHVYHDYSAVPDAVGYTRKKTGGVSTPFPEKLMELLSTESLTNSSIVSWLPHGRAFIVRKPKEFSEHVMHKYFRQTKITSFQRQLNLYGFRRLTQGPDAGAYYHEMFLRGRMQLAARMTRQKVKGIGHKQPSHRESEPNLYALPHLPEDSPSEEATIPPSKEDNTSSHVGNNCAHMSLACLHQTPATATKYYQPSTIAAAAARNVTAGLVTGTSPPLVSPAIQAAKLLKSMATAKVTPGSFPSMLTWAPTSNSSSSSSGRGDASSKHEAATTLLPPPPPLHTEKSSTGRSTGTCTHSDCGHLPENGQEELIKAASRASTDATNRSSSSKMNVDNDDDEDANNVLPPMTSMPSQ